MSHYHPPSFLALPETPGYPTLTVYEARQTLTAAQLIWPEPDGRVQTCVLDPATGLLTAP